MSLHLNGKIVAANLAAQLKEALARDHIELALGILQVGDHPSSSVYIRYKVKMANFLGVSVRHERLPGNISRADLLATVERWNLDDSVTGFIVQLPLPAHIDADEILNAIDPRKDVDGLTLMNKGALATHRAGILPATTRGILSLLDYYKISVTGKHVVVLGRSNLVGLPTALALLHQDATITIVHSLSQNTDAIIRTADLVVSAVGKPGIVTRKMLSPHAVVIDVGISSIKGTLHGDVDFSDVQGAVTAITPVPGGVGPLTVISLFQNLYDISLKKMRHNHEPIN